MTKKSSEATHILALGDNSQAIYRDFLKGMLNYSRLHGCRWVLYINSPSYLPVDLKEVTVENIRRWKIDGIVDYLSNPEKTAEISSIGLPHIIINNGAEKQDIGKYTVNIDNKKIGQMGADYLLEKKFLDFAYCGFRDVYWSQERGKAFADKITKAGLNVHVYEQPYTQKQSSQKDKLPELAEWLKTLKKPVGLMACSDKRAQHVLEACYMAKLNVPDEVAVLGVDNDDFFCELTYPPLSSISMNTKDIGYRAAEILNQCINGKNPPPKKLLFQPTSIIERESTDMLAISDELVKRAVGFIRLNRMRPISASDVAEAVYSTTRTLDRRFKKALGEPVHGIIIKVRIEQACHMLTTSNLSISQIAYKLGYPEPKHLTQAFKREKGVSPLTYRKNAGNP